MSGIGPSSSQTTSNWGRTVNKLEEEGQRTTISWEKQMTHEGLEKQRLAVGMTLTPGNRKTEGDQLESISADEDVVDKLNTKQQSTLVAGKDNSILDSISKSQEVWESHYFLLFSL